MKLLIFILLFYMISNYNYSQNIEITSPSTNDKEIKKGTKLNIKWKYEDEQTDRKKLVKIVLVGKTETVLSESAAMPQGFDWEVKSEPGKYKIRISNNDNALETGTSIEFEITDDVEKKEEEKEDKEGITEIIISILKSFKEYKSYYRDPKNSVMDITEKKLNTVKDIAARKKQLKELIDKEEDVTLKKLYNEEYSKIEKLLKNLDGRGFSVLSLIGNAGIFNSNTTTGSSISGNGSIGVEFTSSQNRFYTKALLIILSSPDTVKAKYTPQDSINVSNSEEFGRSVVNPFSGSKSVQSGYIEFREFLWKLYGDTPNFGLQGYIGYSNRKWRDSTFYGDELFSANILAASAGFFWNPLSSYTKNLSDLDLIIHFAGTTRLLYGDIRNNSPLRKKLIGSESTDFFGIEIGFQIKYKGFSGFITLPALFSSSSVKGLTSGQFVGGFSVTTSIQDFEF